MAASLSARVRKALLPWLDPPAYVAALMARSGLRDEGDDVLRLAADDLLNAWRARLQRKLATLPEGERPIRALGGGMDFARLREYQPGDDARALDWNVYARTRIPHVREYYAEKTLTAWLLVDLTPSMTVGGRRRKSRQAVAMAAVTGMLAQKAGYRLGLMAFDGHQTRLIKPAVGLIRLQALVETLQIACREAEARAMELWDASKSPHVPRLADDALLQALSEARRLIQRRSWVALFSDLASDSVAWPAAMADLGRACDLVVALIHDPCELDLSRAPLACALRDPETAQALEIPVRSKAFYVDYARLAREQLEARRAQAKFAAHCQATSTTADPLEAALSLLAAFGGWAA